LIFAVLTAFQLLGQVSGGYLGDLFNKRIICAACMFGHTGGLLMLTYAESLLGVLAFTALHGLGWGIRGPLMVSLRADYFGPRSFGTIMGFSSLIVMLGMSSGPIVVGYMADQSGSYESGFTLVALLSLLGSVCFVAATPPNASPGKPATVSVS
jgi:MFS family permease